MSPDEPSLSDHEQRILAEIERNLAAEDPEFVRQVSEARPRTDTSRLWKLGVLGILLGVPLLLFNSTSLIYGVLGFLVLLGSVVAIVTSVRQLTSSPRAPSSVFRDALKRAEERMRSRRRDR